MELIRELGNVPPNLKGGVLSVGVFDGVHVGHQAVLGRAVERAHELDTAAVVFTFHRTRWRSCVRTMRRRLSRRSAGNWN